MPPGQPVILSLHKNIARAVRKDQWDRFSPATRVLLRAYLVGILSTLLPALPSIWRKRHLWQSIWRLVNHNSFACSLALAFGGARWLQDAIKSVAYRAMLKSAREDKDPVKCAAQIDLASAFLGSAISSLLALRLFQRQPTLHTRKAPSLNPLPVDTGSYKALTQRKKSSTLDLVLFTFVRAVDAAIRSAWFRVPETSRRSALGRLLAGQADTLVFWLSSWRIMWTWFYKAHRLPKSFARWISDIAQIDDRLRDLLVMARSGRWTYGKPLSAGDQVAVRDLATAHGLDPSCMDPEEIGQIPCRLVHGQIGNTDSCSVNVARRFMSTFTRATVLYSTVYTISTILFSSRSLSVRQLATDILRSSTFLSTFVASIWATVCFTRQCGPILLPQMTQQRWDGGGLTMAASAVCGLSILLERRKGELALSAAPRALSTLLQPRKISLRIEQIVFAASFATLYTAETHSPKVLRGLPAHVFSFINRDSGNNVQ